MALFLDTDPGLGTPGGEIDDGWAIALALAHPDLDLRALGTVVGNVDLEAATANALALVARSERAVPVHRGAARPIVQDLSEHRRRLRARGGDPARGAPARGPPADLPAALAIVEHARRRPDLHLVAIGPLTNLALAVLLQPRLPRQVASLVVMGGAARVSGNVTPFAEFNFWCDPEAAEVVLSAGFDPVVVGLDVTRQVVFDRPFFAELAERPGDRVVTHAAAWTLHHTDPERLEAGRHLHDVMALAHLVEPGLLELESVSAGVELADPDRRGMLLVEPAEGGRRDCRIAVAVDGERLRDLARETLTA